jgi:L-histidine N-alpha-methyltransferase
VDSSFLASPGILQRRSSLFPGCETRPLVNRRRYTHELRDGRVTVRTLEEAAGEELEQMIKDVRAGLLSSPKDLSPWPKYFYDEKGSELFEEITTLPEYYQTRTELSILREKAPEIIARTHCRELVELGSGSASKTRALLDAMMAQRERFGSYPVRYVPLDISESALTSSARRLFEEYPALEISGFVGDFDHSLEYLLAHPRQADEPAGRLVIFLGGTIGNFTPEWRRSFLDRMRAGLKEGDHLLVGVDLFKDAPVLEAAYDDAAGVTARFNKNLLNVLNRELGGQFDPELFAHRALYDAEAERVEMWLDSKVAQKVPVAALGLEVPFEAGEGMRTEISAKFTRESVATTFREAGLRLLDLYTDDEDRFGLALGALT